MAVTLEQLTPGTRFKPNGRGFSDQAAARETVYVVMDYDTNPQGAFTGPEWIHAVREGDFKGDTNNKLAGPIFALYEIGEIL